MGTLVSSPALLFDPSLITSGGNCGRCSSQGACTDDDEEEPSPASGNWLGEMGSPNFRTAQLAILSENCGAVGNGGQSRSNMVQTA